MDFPKYSGMELIHIYGELLSQMRWDGLIRSKNVTGDLGEYIVVDYYTKTKGLPNINFSRCNKAMIYAPNGVMKSSLSKVFDDISKGTATSDRIFQSVVSSYSVTHYTSQYVFSSANATTICVVNRCDLYILKQYDLIKAFENYPPLNNTIFPEGIETVPKRFAISWRNKWMLKRADVVVTYVTHNYGGAAQFAHMAKQQKKKIIALGGE